MIEYKKLIYLSILCVAIVVFYYFLLYLRNRYKENKWLNIFSEENVKMLLAISFVVIALIGYRFGIEEKSQESEELKKAKKQYEEQIKICENINKENISLKSDIDNIRKMYKGGLFPAIKELSKDEISKTYSGKRAMAYIKTYLYEIDMITASKFYEDFFLVKEFKENTYIEKDRLSSKWNIKIKRPEGNFDRLRYFHFVFDVGVKKRDKYKIPLKVAIIKDKNKKEIENVFDYIKPLGPEDEEILFGLEVPIKENDFNIQGIAEIEIKLYDIIQENINYSLYGYDIRRYKNGIENMKIFLHFKNNIYCAFEPVYDPSTGIITLREEGASISLNFKMNRWGPSKWGPDEDQEVKEQFVYQSEFKKPKFPVFFYFEQEKSKCLEKNVSQ